MAQPSALDASCKEPFGAAFSEGFLAGGCALSHRAALIANAALGERPAFSGPPIGVSESNKGEAVISSFQVSAFPDPFAAFNHGRVGWGYLSSAVTFHPPIVIGNPAHQGTGLADWTANPGQRNVYWGGNLATGGDVPVRQDYHPLPTDPVPEPRPAAIAESQLRTTKSQIPSTTTDPLRPGEVAAVAEALA